MSYDIGETWYENINQHLLRIQRTGTPTAQDVEGTDVVVSLEELRETLLPQRECCLIPSVAEEFENVEKYDNDDDDEDEQEQEAKKEAKRLQDTYKFLDAARLLSPKEERRVLIKEIFEQERRYAYELVNESRQSAGEQPWYILTPEEVDLVGFVLPYDLVKHPDPKFIQRAIKAEGQRIKDLLEAGQAATRWSTWNENHQERGELISEF